MKESRLITLLNSFSDTDWKLFLDFGKSKYSENSDTYKLVKYLKKQNGLIDHMLNDPNYLHGKVKSKLDTRSFKNLITKLCGFIEDYMIWAEIDSNETEKNIFKLKVFAKRGLSKRFNKLNTDIVNSKSEVSLWSSFLSFTRNHYSYYYDMFESNDFGYSELKNSYDALKKFTAEMECFYSIEMKNRQRVFGENWNEIIQKIGFNDETETSLNNIIKLITEMTILRQEKSFDKLYHLLMSNVDWSLEIKNTVMIHLLSFMNNLTKQGQLEYVEKLLSLYSFGIESKILFPNSRIPTRRFFNILNVACIGENPELASSFLSKYYTKVKNKKPDEVYTLGVCQIDFANGKYKKVAIELNKYRFKDFDMEFKARWLKLCCQYEEEKNNIGFMEGEIITFKNFVKRNQSKLDVSTVQGAQALVRMIKILLKKSDRNLAIEKLRDEKFIVSRNWISKKIHKDLK